MKKSRIRKISSKRLYLKNLIYTDLNVIDSLKNTWNHLPDDATEEERFIMIELIESTLRIYNNLRSERQENELTMKN